MDSTFVTIKNPMTSLQVNPLTADPKLPQYVSSYEDSRMSRVYGFTPPRRAGLNYEVQTTKSGENL